MSIKNRALFANRHRASGIKKNITTLFSLTIVIIVAIFFGSWVRYLNNQGVSDLAENFPDISLEKNEAEKNKNALEKQTVGAGIVYEDSDLGFELILPKDGRRYAVKEITSKGLNQAILFGLPITDQEIQRIKKEKYSEIFRIKLVPVADLESKKSACADSTRQLPFCDADDRELGRNEQFVFVYTRYDKLDEVEKSKTRLIPTDFDAAIFAQADEISKSFRVVAHQIGLADKKL